MVLKLTTCSRNPQFRPPKPCLSNPTGLAPPLIWTAVSYILHDMGLSWRLGLALGFLFGWLYSAVRELRWCVERIYFAVGNSVEDTAEDNAGFPWARARRIR